jgi:hypothetical protein
VAFGLGLLSDLTLPGAWRRQPAPTLPALHIQLTMPQEIAERWSGLDSVGWEGTIDDAPFAAQRGVVGDHRFVHGASPDSSPGETTAGPADRPATLAVHHLSPDLSTLLCAPADPTDPSWWRVVLDSVLFTAALLHGYEALHAGAIATPEGAIAITAGTGGGKSTLVSELLGRGLALMADDVLVLERANGDGQADGPPIAYPAPPLMTVPADRVPGALSTPEQAGSVQPIALVGDERWIATPVHPYPLPLRTLVILNRHPGLTTGLSRADRPLATLLDSLLNYPRARAREGTRFEMAAAIAAHVPIWRLDADPSVPPSALADRLLSGLDEKRTYGTRPDVVSRKQ